MTRAAPWHQQNAHHRSACLEWIKLRLQQWLPESEVTEAQVAEAMAARLAAAAMNPPLALVPLGKLFDLNWFEPSVLFICAAMELALWLTALCAQVHGNDDRPYPTFALVMEPLEEPMWRVLSPERSLRSWRLIEVQQAGSRELTSNLLKAEERVVSYLKGNHYMNMTLQRNQSLLMAGWFHD
ncbi:hypothetical protein H6F86_03060 [Phormidium sp. FACHB-592]|uniref:Winged helix domain-containing protein n=1 Tax=Stenomitos frigidus AS-A4 TaxID=2933935 RepID=A0ABV0KRF3_9CYAN|nr:hypothetical protein [Phormidium sp. FACHB-592]MBD2072881.1 hypothetical protein [Phormidium sp. FACHB-592]